MLFARCIFRFELTFLLGHGPNFHYLSSKDTPGPPKIANVLYGNLSYQYFAGLGLGSMTSLSSFTQTCPIPNFTIFVPQIAPTCEILEVTTTIHPQYQERVSSDLAYSFLEMTQPGSAPANDFDTRTEKKLEQLKHVEIDQSWFTGTLGRGHLTTATALTQVWPSPPLRSKYQGNHSSWRELLRSVGTHHCRTAFRRDQVVLPQGQSPLDMKMPSPERETFDSSQPRIWD
jgi:hypothetical protein